MNTQKPIIVICRKTGKKYDANQAFANLKNEKYFQEMLQRMAKH